MSLTISSTSRSQPGDADSATQKPASSKVSSPRAGVDTVHISSNAQAAAKAAMQEATETHFQTVQEAQHGDRQAQRLLAKETAQTRQ